MSIHPRQSVAEESGALAALEELFRPFAPGWEAHDCAVVHPDSIPHPQDHLLVHHDHMTVVLQKHHGAPVAVNVLEEHREGDLYTRKISLATVGGGPVVEWGICRLNLRHMPAAVGDEILARKTPLGAILIRHNVHRRVKPRYFLRLPEHSDVMQILGAPDNAEPVYGRIGTIYCDNEPAIELLETVVNCRKEGLKIAN
jgi:chorismate-pyruvate lyase